jgi:oligoendopeptidase F
LGTTVRLPDQESQWPNGTASHLPRNIVQGMSTTAPESVAWDLEPLVDGEGEAGADRLLAEADQRATAFADQHAGKVADLDGAGLVAAVNELGDLSELVGRAGSYAMLRFAVDTADPANGALLQRVQ